MVKTGMELSTTNIYNFPSEAVRRSRSSLLVGTYRVENDLRAIPQPTLNKTV